MTCGLHLFYFRPEVTSFHLILQHLLPQPVLRLSSSKHRLLCYRFFLLEVMGAPTDPRRFALSACRSCRFHFNGFGKLEKKDNIPAHTARALEPRLQRLKCDGHRTCNPCTSALYVVRATHRQPPPSTPLEPKTTSRNFWLHVVVPSNEPPRIEAHGCQL